MNVLQSDNAVTTDAGSSNPFIAKANTALVNEPTARSSSLFADGDSLQAIPAAPKQMPLEDDKPFMWVSF